MTEVSDLATYLAQLAPRDSWLHELARVPLQIDFARHRRMEIVLEVPPAARGREWAPHLSAVWVSSALTNETGLDRTRVVLEACLTGVALSLGSSDVARELALARALYVAGELTSHPLTNRLKSRWDQDLLGAAIGAAVGSADLLGLDQDRVAAAVDLSAPCALAIRTEDGWDGFAVGLRIFGAVESALLACAGAQPPPGVLASVFAAAW